MQKARQLRGKIIVRWVTLLLGICVFGWCYHDVLVWMYQRYIGADSYYSHGFLVPFITAYMIYQRREELSRLTFSGSAWGLLLIGVALFLHIAGTVLYVFLISGVSIIFLVFGISLLLFGARATSIISFPLAFLIFMLPLPIAVIGAVSVPLKNLVTKISVGIVSLMDIPIFREGFNITIPNGRLIVGNPCSGLRSLIAFLGIGTFLAYLEKISFVRKISLVLWTIPIAIAANVIRVLLLILISHYAGLDAAAPGTFWHFASGVIMFAIGLSALFGVRFLLEWKK
jgi:exosortase